MRNLTRWSTALMAGALMLSTGQAWAQSQAITDTFEVRINVQGTCTVLTATDIDFGTQVSTVGTYDQTGTIRVQCTKDLPFTLGLDGGSTASDVNARAMVNATGIRIPYTLRRTAANGPVWGNDSSNWHAGTGLGLGTSYEVALTVYARATLAGTEPAGAYLDTVTATLTY